jgi:DNA replication protein DnaC
MILDLVKHKLKLMKMASALLEIEELVRESKENKLTEIEFLNNLLECELNGRSNKRIQRRIKQAQFPVIKSMADFDYSIRSSLNKHEIQSFCEGEFVDKKENLIFVGSAGLGKTHLSIGIAYEMCKKDKRVWFTTGTGLINKLREARDEKVLAKFFTNAQKLDLVVLDEIGYFPFEKEASELFFQYISERYERGSMIITSNLPFSKWNEIFYTERLTTAILDRLIHHCHIFEVSGESYRFSQSVSKKKVKEEVLISKN